jgi:hypothetical protein
LIELQTATPGSNVTLPGAGPGAGAHTGLFFVEKLHRHAGLQAPAVVRDERLRAVREQHLARAGAVRLHRRLRRRGSIRPRRLWLSAARGVWTGSFASPFTLDVSDDVVEAHVEIDETSGSARLVLRNDATSGQTGRYAGYGSGALANLRRGARSGSAPATTRPTARRRAPATRSGSRSRADTGAGRAADRPAPGRLVAARELAGARGSTLWPARKPTCQSILAFICSRAGLSFARSSQRAAVNLYPAFTISPGENGKTAVLRLAAMVPDRLMMRGSILHSRQVSIRGRRRLRLRHVARHRFGTLCR